MRLVPSGDGVLLDALDAVSEDPGDDLLVVVLARSIGGLEFRLPKDHRTVLLVVSLDPKFRRVVLDGEGALDDFVAIGSVLGAGELFLDLAAILQRERAVSHVAVLGLLAFGDGRMPRLDRAEGLAGDGPDAGRQPGRLDSLLHGHR